MNGAIHNLGTLTVQYIRAVDRIHVIPEHSDGMTEPTKSITFNLNLTPITNSRDNSLVIDIRNDEFRDSLRQAISDAQRDYCIPKEIRVHPVDFAKIRARYPLYITPTNAMDEIYILGLLLNPSKDIEPGTGVLH